VKHAEHHHEGAAQSLSAPIAAALVSMKRHMKIRRYQISWLRAFFPNRKGMTHAHLYGIRHCCSPLPRDANFRQAQGTPPQSQAQTPPDQASTVIRSIQVVDIKDLKPALRSKVGEVVAHIRQEDMRSLRNSIDATPEAADALKAKGLSSSQVVAINIVDGILTMFAKTA
jgi:hypothetical protein